MTLDLFDRPAPDSDQPRTIEGEIQMDIGLTAPRRYAWTLHLDRITDDWTETTDELTERPQPPGWAFGLLFLGPAGDWRPVRHYDRTWAGWAIVRDLPEVRRAIGDRLLPRDVTAGDATP